MFVFVSYLFVLFRVIGEAVWILFLLFFPIVTALVSLLARPPTSSCQASCGGPVATAHRNPSLVSLIVVIVGVVVLTRPTTSWGVLRDR